GHSSGLNCPHSRHRPEHCPPRSAVDAPLASRYPRVRRNPWRFDEQFRHLGRSAASRRIDRPHVLRSPVTGLQVRDLVVRFGGLAALSEVSFDVPDGGVTGVIGPNGAGKTTLFNVISGFVSPTSGSMTWQGQPWKPRPDRLVHAGIARTLQGVGLFGQLSAVENVMVGAAKRRTTGFVSALLALPRSDRDEAKLRADALDALERVGAADIASTIAGTLPYPLQKKV